MAGSLACKGRRAGAFHVVSGKIAHTIDHFVVSGVLEQHAVVQCKVLGNDWADEGNTETLSG